MLCHRGCGLPSTYTNYKGLPCCAKSASKCPDTKKKIGKKNSVALAGKKLTEEHKSKISKGLAGHEVSKESRRKSSESNRKYWAKCPREAWNKGLGIADPRVAAYANKQRGKEKAKRIKLIPSNDPVYQDFKKYRNRIAVRTKNNYNRYKNEINPHNLLLGKAGVPRAHHVDLIMSVREAFTYSVPIELVASKENLRVIPWQENNSKYSKVDYAIVPETIKQYLKENKIHEQ